MCGQETDQTVSLFQTLNRSLWACPAVKCLTRSRKTLVIHISHRHREKVEKHRKKHQRELVRVRETMETVQEGLWWPSTRLYLTNFTFYTVQNTRQFSFWKHQSAIWSPRCRVRNTQSFGPKVRFYQLKCMTEDAKYVQRPPKHSVKKQ